MDKLKAVFCALFGHSRIQSAFFGYFHCGRCQAQVGDTLAGVYDARGVVIEGHDCDQCRKNYAGFTWRDKLLVPYPFKQREPQHSRPKGD